MSDELTVRGETLPLTASDLIAWKRTIREVMDAVMKKNVHYGQIAGGMKPSLWQPGAETLLLTFKLYAELAVDDLSTSQAARYRVTAVIRAIGSNNVVGMGIGEASSEEEKYCWRRVDGENEWQATPENKRREKWKDNRPIRQVRTTPADVANTILKMAKKRALVDGARTATGASDFFDQDLEDLPDGMLNETRKPIERPQAKAAEPKAEATKPATAPPPAREREPGEDDEEEHGPPADPRWQAVSDAWHDKGNVSDKQLGRLFALARKNGNDEGAVRAAINDNLGVKVESIPWGKPYDLIVEILAGVKAEERK
jgi:hypothetical protein